MKLAVIGTGYVGLVTGTCFAEYGNTVICVDNNEDKIERLRRGIIPIWEPGLEEIVKDNIEIGNLTFTSDIKEAVNASDIVFICVGTPQKEDGSTDMQYIEAVAKQIGESLEHEVIVADKSTVPVGTAIKVKKIIDAQLAALNKNLDIAVISNPEFLKEGTAVADCMRPDRVIVGVDNTAAGAAMRELYTPFLRHRDQYIEMDLNSAEMTKYAANAMLATKISFINEIANICELVGADINQVRTGIGSDSRIGYSFIYPGIGYGGSCFPKDVRSLVNSSQLASYDAQLLRSVDDVNNRQKRILNKKIAARFGEDLSGLTFAVWGLAFKPDTDDMREAPSLEVINYLVKKGARVQCYDPKAMRTAKEYLGQNEAITYGANRGEVLEGADALLLLTEWKEFKSPDFEYIKQTLKTPLIFDGKNQYDDRMLASIGIESFRIGLG
ncbi:UDP-glucose 6-dehydrogenase [Betaproteobacteria bacterium]|nr:UDP-glucose 6-dehydrogenase [Betaproteobacteria bacterium]